jgi:hypothetical protein
MDSLITAAARALAAGDPLGALKRIALCDDAPALALRGMAMAQLDDLPRARELLRRAARAFGPSEAVARARCIAAEAEIALVSRDLVWSEKPLDDARRVLEASGDKINAAHVTYLKARRLLLIGKLDEAAQTLDDIDPAVLPPPSRVGYELVVTGIAMRQIRTQPARDALARAERAADEANIAALTAEVALVSAALDAPAAQLSTHSENHFLVLQDVETLFSSSTLVIDTCRNALRAAKVTVPLASRPILFTLLRTLAEAWPSDVTRETLLARTFHARFSDESHRARLRVEIGRLRKAIKPLALLDATERGFVLTPLRTDQVVVLLPPVESDHADVLALLADGEAWSSSALALALGVSQRTIQRALDTLAEAEKVRSFGNGRSRRWTAPSVPGFPTSLLLPTSPPKV